MTNHEVFTRIDPDLCAVLEELRRREPIFHTPEFGTTLADFENSTAPEYWEVGASGRRYSREFILRTLNQNPPSNAASVGWQSYDHGLRRLGPDTYLFTYTLRQAERLTRRATIGRLLRRAGAFSIIRALSSPPKRTTRSLAVGFRANRSVLGPSRGRRRYDISHA